MGLLEKIFGDMNSREIKKIEKIVDQIEAYDEEMQALTVTSCAARQRNLKKDLQMAKI